MKNTYYTCLGTIRKDCRTQHKTLEAAQRCLERDQSKCKAHNGETDRVVMFFNGFDFEPVEKVGK